MNLAEQPFAQPEPVFHHVSSVTFTIHGPDAHARIVEECARWAIKRNHAVPQAAFEGLSFEVGGDGIDAAQGVAIRTGGLRTYALSVSLSDTGYAGRTWITEMVVTETAPDRAEFSALLRNTTLQGYSLFERSVPGIVRQLVEKLDARKDGRRLQSRMVRVDAGAGVDDLISLMTDPGRRAPILVGSEVAEKSGISFAAPEDVAARLYGACHLFYLTADAVWDLTDRIGKKLSVFNGAYRMYLPGLSLETADPYAHPLWFTFADDDPALRLRQLCDRVLLFSKSMTRAEGLIGFQDIRQQAATTALEETKSEEPTEEYTRLLEQEVTRLQADLQAARGEQDNLLSEFEKAQRTLDQQVAELKAALEAAEKRHLQLQDRFERFRKAAGPDVTEPLSDYAGFADWAAANLSHRVWFAPKALKAMEDALFWRPDLLGDALVMLDRLFVGMKLTPGRKARAAYDDRLRQLGCSDQPCFGDPGAIRQFPEYQVTYEGRKYPCEDHVKHGGGTDPRKHFRIYYHWLAEEQRLLIGHLPTHLDNKLTN